MENNYDLFCNSRFSLSESRFSRICNVDPVIRLIGASHVGDDGCLGIAVTQLESLWLVKAFRRFGIEAYPLPEKYKFSKVLLEEAKDTAQKFILDKRRLDTETDLADVEEITLPWWLSKIAFGFISRSEKMKLDGTSPAGVTMCVDRVSGAILSPRQLFNAELSIMLTE